MDKKTIKKINDLEVIVCQNLEEEIASVKQMIRQQNKSIINHKQGNDKPTINLKKEMEEQMNQKLDTFYQKVMTKIVCLQQNVYNELDEIRQEIIAMKRLPREEIIFNQNLNNRASKKRRINDENFSQPQVDHIKSLIQHQFDHNAI